MDKSRWARYLLLAAVLICPVIFFFEGLNPQKVLRGYDIITLALPFEMFLRHTMAKYHELALWLPCIFTGMPFLDSSNTPFCYPSNLVFLLLNIPAGMSFTLQVMLHMYIAGFGMYLFAKDTSGSARAAVFAAIAYAFSPVILSQVSSGQINVIEASALIPYAFYFTRRAAGSGSLSGFLAAGLAAALMCLCLMFQLAIYTYLALAFYMMFLTVSDKSGSGGRLKKILFFAASAASIAVFSAPQFLLSAQYAGETWRFVMADSERYFGSLPAAQLITLILPNFFGLTGDASWGSSQYYYVTEYMGLLPLLLAGFAFMGKGKKGGNIFFLSAAAVSLALSLGNNTPVYRFFSALPGMGFFRGPDKFMYLCNFSITVLAASGFANVFEGNEKRPPMKRAVIIFMAICMALTAAMLACVSGLWGRFIAMINPHFPPNATAAAMGFINSDILAAFIIVLIFSCAAVLARRSSLQKYTLLFLSALAAVQIADSYRIDSRFISFSGLNTVISENNPVDEMFRGDRSIYRVNPGNAAKLPNQNIYYGIETVSGYHGNAPLRQFKLINSGAFSYLGVNRLFNVKYYLSSTPIPGLKQVFNGKISVYEDDKCMPRFYFSRKTSAVSADDSFRMVSTGSVPEYGAAAEGLPSGAGIGGPGNNSAEVELYSPNRIVLKVFSGNGGLLVNSNSYYKGLKAAIDNRDTPIYRVNYTASGVLAGPGVHTVEFYMDPKPLIMSVIVMLLGLLILAVTAVMDNKRIKN